MAVKNAIGFGPLKGPDRSMLFGSGLVLAYTENGAIVTVNDGGQVTTMGLGLTTTAVSNGICGFNLQGVASADLNLRVEIMHSGSVAATFLTRVKAGPATVAAPFLLVNIPAESASWSLRMRADGGSWTMPANLSSWWIESGAIEGGLIATDPSSTVADAVNQTPHVITDSVIIDEETPIGASVADTVDQTPLDVTDSMTVILANVVYPSSGSEDGYCSPTVFNTGLQITQAGNTSGESRGSFWLFHLPEDLGGAAIDRAFLDVVPDSNMSTPVSVVVSTAFDQDPAPVTSYADMAGRGRGATVLSTSVTAQAGVTLSFDITAQVAAIAAGAPYGGFWGLLVFMEDNGSSPEALLNLRSRDYAGVSTNQPALRLQFHDLVAFGYYAGYAGGF